MSIITFIFWGYVVRCVIFLFIISIAEYPRKQTIKLGADVITLIVGILILIWIGLVKYGVMPVNL